MSIDSTPPPQTSFEPVGLPAVLRLLASLLVAAALLLSPHARANVAAAPVALSAATSMVPLSSHVDFLEDRGGSLSLDDVRAAAADRFAPVPSGSEINFGYSASAYWLRFTLRAEEIEAHDWLLEVAFPSLDRVELYAPENGGYRQSVVGDLQPFSARPIANRNFVFPLLLADGQARTYYLRISSSGTLTVPLRLWQPAAFSRYSEDAYAGMSVYYGMLLALMLYNLLLYVSIRDRIYLTYVLFVAGMAVGQLSLNGLGNQYIWTAWVAWGNVALPVGLAASGFFAALFARRFLATQRTAPRLDKLMVVLASAFAISALATVAVSYRSGAILTSITGLAFSLAAVGAAIHCLRQGHREARYFLLAWTLLLAGVAVMAMRNLSWLPTNALTSYAMQVGSAFEMLLLSFALADRINVTRREKEQAQAEALAAEEATVQALRESERQLEARVAARTRELEDANARLREKEVQLKSLAHHDPLTGLANRLLLGDRIEQGIERAARSSQPMAILTLDLDGFKPVNDQFGHATGDEILKAVACRLQASVRATDTVARIGGDEFVIVLENLQSAHFAEHMADKLVTALGAPVILRGRPFHVTTSVGIAIYPKDGKNAATLLESADRAMYSAKHAGRNCYACSN
ncbi:MAG TPA: diguanylate cyclase [Aromatoleum sp.]|uniref:diguanylate cyclase n=1 Tax=Aromatoleum sp. TaxID=2307007 RepID=UPI002B45BC53|nr:diguanylate cyclase [Aromatoleum sp.]HJV27378.1 diguanylate cyclase [Aromatoleum sp.]